MIKRTLYFGNPAYLSTHLEQLEVRLRDPSSLKLIPDVLPKKPNATIPIEDIGVVILDHPQIVISQALMAKLLANNVAIITCDASHLPTGLMLNLCGHTLQAARFRAQINAPATLLRQLWQQTVQAKIKNQARLLQQLGIEAGNLLAWSRQVQSGDATNLEGRAAIYYWKNLFSDVADFQRERFGLPPNNLLNYAYAIVRGAMARSLVGSGLLPTLGIHHHHRNNHYCLADDIMEPYRPFADALVKVIHDKVDPAGMLTPAVKKQILSLLTIDVLIEKERSPLMIAMHRTTASLAKCFEGEGKKLIYPEFTELPCV